MPKLGFDLVEFLCSLGFFDGVLDLRFSQHTSGLEPTDLDFVFVFQELLLQFLCAKLANHLRSFAMKDRQLLIAERWWRNVANRQAPTSRNRGHGIGNGVDHSLLQLGMHVQQFRAVASSDDGEHGLSHDVAELLHQITSRDLIGTLHQVDIERVPVTNL